MFLHFNRTMFHLLQFFTATSYGLLLLMHNGLIMLGSICSIVLHIYLLDETSLFSTCMCLYTLSSDCDLVLQIIRQGLFSILIFTTLFKNYLIQSYIRRLFHPYVVAKVFNVCLIQFLHMLNLIKEIKIDFDINLLFKYNFCFIVSLSIVICYL